MVDPGQGEDALASLWRTVDANPALAGSKLRGLIAAIDAHIAAQLAAIMHAPRFLKLEASWRGLHHLIARSETGPHLAIRVLTIDKVLLAKDLTRFEAATDGWVFRKLHEELFGLGGTPFDVLIGDYEFTRHKDDLRLIDELASIAAVANVPFIAAASPALFGLDDFRGLATPSDLSQRFTTPSFTGWRGRRSRDDLRFLYLTVPRVLARRPYGGGPYGGDGAPGVLAHAQHCWMNAAYVAGVLVGRAAVRDGWWATPFDIGGDATIDDLPVASGLEAAIGTGMAEELGDLGFMPLFQPSGADQHVALGTTSVHRPAPPGASRVAPLPARLPCMLAAGRFAQLVLPIWREVKGLLRSNAEWEDRLNAWIAAYVSDRADLTLEEQARYPLVSARITVQDGPPQGARRVATLWLRPRLGGETPAPEMRCSVGVPW